MINMGSAAVRLVRARTIRNGCAINDGEGIVINIGSAAIRPVRTRMLRAERALDAEGRVVSDLLPDHSLTGLHFASLLTSVVKDGLCGVLSR